MFEKENNCLISLAREDSRKSSHARSDFLKYVLHVVHNIPHDLIFAIVSDIVNTCESQAKRFDGQQMHVKPALAEVPAPKSPHFLRLQSKSHRKFHAFIHFETIHDAVHFPKQTLSN